MADLNLNVVTSVDEKGVVHATALVDRLDEGVDDLGDSMRGTAKDAELLQKKIDGTSRKVRELAREIARADDAAKRADLEKAFGSESRTLAKLNRIKKALGDIGDGSPSNPLQKVAGAAAKAGDKAGKTFTQGLIDGVGALPSRLKGALIVGAVGAATAASPFIGAAISSAVVGGIGLGGIAGGIALAARDAQVKQAASTFVDRISAAFSPLGDQFVAPTVHALETLADAGSRVARNLNLSGVVDAVEPLAEGIAGLADHALPGLNKALERAGPLIDVLAEELPGVGDALSDMFDSMSREGDGAVLGLVATFDLLNGTLRTVGSTVEVLSAGWERFVRFIAEFSGDAEDVWGWIPLIGDRARDANDKTEDWLATLDGAVMKGRGATGPAKELADAIAKAGDAAGDAVPKFAHLDAKSKSLFDRWMSVDEAALAVRDALRDVKESLDDNGKAFNNNTEKGDANADAFLAAVDAAELHRAKMIESGQSIPAANRVYQDTVDKLYAQAKAAGVDMAAFDRLLGKYRDLAKEPNIVKTITYRQIFTQSGKAFVPTGGGHAFMAEGGPVTGGTPGRDSVPLLAMPGEFVVPKWMVDRLGGTDRLEDIRTGRGGGFNSRPSSNAWTPAPAAAPQVNISGSVGFVNWFHEMVRTGQIQLSVRSGQTRVSVGT